MGPVNSIWDPLNSAIPVKIWIVKEVVGPVHSAWDPLADTPTWNAHANKKKEKKGKKKEENANAAPWTPIQMRTISTVATVSIEQTKTYCIIVKHIAWNLLTDTPTWSVHANKKKEKNGKKREENTNAAPWTPIQTRTISTVATVSIEQTKTHCIIVKHIAWDPLINTPTWNAHANKKKKKKEKEEENANVALWMPIQTRISTVAIVSIEQTKTHCIIVKVL